MTFEVEVAGHTRAVAVEPAGGTMFRVTLDNRLHLIDVARSGDRSLSLIEEGASCEARIIPGAAAGELLVWLDGQSALVTVDGRRSRTGRAGVSGRAGSPAVIAPMPGRIVRVLVSPGQEVAVGQPLIVVEAMKMENELRSPKAGIVKDVAVAEGLPVEAGRVLIVIE